MPPPEAIAAGAAAFISRRSSRACYNGSGSYTGSGSYNGSGSYSAVAVITAVADIPVVAAVTIAALITVGGILTVGEVITVVAVITVVEVIKLVKFLVKVITVVAAVYGSRSSGVEVVVSWLKLKEKGDVSNQFSRDRGGWRVHLAQEPIACGGGSGVVV